MLKEHLENLFLCTQWHESFPHLFKAIQNVDQNQWDSVFLRINQRIFNDKNKVKHLISLTSELDKKDSLDGLTQFLTSIVEIDPYNLLGLLFKCSENNNCLSQDVFQENSLKNFLRDFSIEQNTIADIINILDAIIPYLNANKEVLKENYLRLYKREDFVSNRADFFDTLVQVRPSLRGNYLPKIFNKKDDLDTPLNTQGQKEALFVLIKGLTRINDTFFSNLTTYRGLLEKNIPCHSENSNLYFSPEKYFDTFISEVSSIDLQGFYDLLLQEIILEDSMAKVCPLLYNNESFAQLNFFHAKEYFFTIIDNDDSLNLLQYILTSLQSSDNKNTAILDFLSSPIFRSTLNFLKSIIHDNEEFLFSLIDIAGSLDNKFYKSLSNLLNNLLSKEHIPQFQRLETLWNFFSREQKNRFFSYADSFIENDSDFVLLLSYFNEVFKILKEDVPFIIQGMSSEEAFGSLKNIVEQFNSANVQNDLRSFYSRDHIMKILKILSDGILEQFSEKEIFSFDKKTTEEKRQISPTIKRNDLTTCFENLSSNTEEQELKSLCPHLGNEKFDFFLNLLSASKIIYSFPSLGRDTLENSKVLESYSNQHDIGIFLKEDTTKNVMKKLLEAVVLLLEGEDGREYRKKLYRVLTHNGTLRIRFKNIIKTLPLILDDWKNFFIDENYYQFRQMPSHYQCNNYNNMNIGGNPCPARSDIPDIIKKGIEIMLKNSDRDLPTLLYRYLSAFSVDHGIPINMNNSASNTYKLTLDESFHFLDKTTDTSRLENKSPIRYINQDFQQSVEETTILQRIETAIREGRFDDNYLITHGVNNIVENIDYSDTVEYYENILRLCSRFHFCGKTMNQYDNRMAKNFLSSLSGVKDINQNELQYGNYARAFLAIHVLSSPRRSRTSHIVNHFVRSQHDLKNHKSNFLTHMASFSLFSNISRIVKDRSLQEKDIQFLSGEFLKNINPHYLETILSSILQTAVDSKNASGDNLITFLTNTMGNLTYSELRTIENTLANALIVLHYLGPLRKQQGELFPENSLRTFFSIGKIFIDEWPSFVEASPPKTQILFYIRKLNDLLLFLKTKLHDTKSQQRYYNFINESFYFLKKIILIENRNLNLPKLYTRNTTVNTRKIYEIFDVATHFDKNQFHESLVSILTLLNDDKLQFETYLSYLNLVSNESHDHFDRPYRLLEFFAKNFDTLYSNLIEKNREISNFLRRILTSFSLGHTESRPSLN